MKLKFLSLFAALAGSSLLYAAPHAEIADSCSPPSKPCKQAKVVPMPSCSTCQDEDPCCPPMTVYNKNINPPARCTQSSFDLFATGAFLWWRADEADFSLSLQQQTAYGVTGANGDVVQFSYNWDPGFRAGLGWQSSTAEGWDIYLDWTWLRDTASVNQTTATGDNFGFVPYWGRFATGEPGLHGYFGTLAASWRLLYNMIDLELGRDFYVSCGLSLRPYISVEGGWINRKWKVTYSDVHPLSTDTPTEIATYSTKSNYWGVGPRIGLGGKWWLSSGFNFFGNLSGSFLSGSVFKNTATLSRSVAGLPLTPDNWRNNDVFRIVPHLQAIVGLGWNTCFSCNKYGLSLTAGWEVNQFWNIPMVLYPDTLNENGVSMNHAWNRINRSNNVALAGLTAEVRFDF